MILALANGGGRDAPRFEEVPIFRNPSINAIENALAVPHRNMRILRSGDDALSFIETLRFDFGERLGELLLKFGEHKTRNYADLSG